MPSAAYSKSIDEQRAHHAESKTFSGSLVLPHVPRIVELARSLGCASGLDYGCGKGVQFEQSVNLRQGAHALESGTIEELLRFKFAKFDPCVPRFAEELPYTGRYDLTIVSHVLFWIPSVDLEGWVLAELFRRTNKLLVVIETIGPEKKRMLSDRDAHPRFEHAIDWVDLLVRHKVGRAQVCLITEHRAADGRIYAGEWRL